MPFLLLALTACSPSPPSDSEDETAGRVVDEGQDSHDSSPIAPDSADTAVEDDPGPVASTGLQHFECFDGVTSCAQEGPFIDDTCCAEGPALQPTGTAGGAEVVGLAVQDDLVVACGGFGARVSRLVSETDAHPIGVAGQRCQRAAIGDGETFYITHHGDTWVETPSLQVWYAETESIAKVHSETDPTILFEGVAWADDTLYVAAHAGGVRVYDAPARSEPSLVTVLGGFDDALTLEAHAGHLYVLDDQTLRVFSLASPQAPEAVGTLALPGKGRELHADGDVLAIALGSQGLVTVDIADPTEPVQTGQVRTGAAMMDVAVQGDRLAVAAWTHLLVYDTASLTLRATTKARAQDAYEQDLALAWRDDELVVGEWDGVFRFSWREGYVGADIWGSSDAVWIADDVATVRIENRGPLQLRGTASIEGGTVQPSSFTLETGEAVGLTVTASSNGTLVLDSNDVDATQDPWALPVYVLSEGGQLGVGEKLTAEFGFLSDTGVTQDLEGQVLVLAYFALF